MWQPDGAGGSVRTAGGTVLRAKPNPNAPGTWTAEWGQTGAHPRCIMGGYATEAEAQEAARKGAIVDLFRDLRELHPGGGKD